MSGSFFLLSSSSSSALRRSSLTWTRQIVAPRFSPVPGLFSFSRLSSSSNGKLLSIRNLTRVATSYRSTVEEVARDQPLSTPISASPTDVIQSAANISEEAIEVDQDAHHASTNTSEEILEESRLSDTQRDEMTDNNMLLYRNVSVAEILKGKERYGDSVHSVLDTDKVLVAVEMMNYFGIGAVLVKDEKGKIVGIMSTRDYMIKVGSGNMHPHNSLVRDIMKPQSHWIYNDESTLSCLESMMSHGVRWLPVKNRENDQVCGLISIGDAVRSLLKQFRDTSSHMNHLVKNAYSYTEDYVSSSTTK